jgi:hypothetical protein
MLKMVDLLLEQPDIDPNDDSTSWPPLKAAVSNLNVQCAQKLLRHPDTVSQVTVVGLTCDVVPHILPDITLVFPQNEKVQECFMAHGRSLHDGDEAVEKGLKFKRAVQDRIRRNSAPSSRKPRGDESNPFSAHRKQQNTHGAAKAASSSDAPTKPIPPLNKLMPKKWNYIMNPNDFDSLWDAAFFFTTGGIEWERCRDAVKLLVLIIGAHTLIVGGSCVIWLRSVKDAENNNAAVADAGAGEQQQPPVAAAAPAAEAPAEAPLQQ